MRRVPAGMGSSVIEYSPEARRRRAARLRAQHEREDREWSAKSGPVKVYFVEPTVPRPS